MSDLILPCGTPVKCGLVHPEVMRFGAVPAWADANPVLPENECEDHDDLAPFCDPPKEQHFNNCTNASLAWLAKVAFRAAGAEDVPDLSMSFLYALNNGGQDQGAMCRDVAAGWLGKGLPPAALWPERNIFVPRTGIPADVYAAALKWAGLEVYQCLNWADVRSALARRFLVYHGFSLGQAFFNTHGDGKVPSFDGRVANGHAMGSRGLSRKFGDLRAIVPNTWGSAFGESGVGYVDASYFWDQRGDFVNLDAYAIRAPKIDKPLPAVS